MERGREWRWRELEPLRPELLRFVARRCRDENDAEDVVQETLLRAARYRRSLAEPHKLKAWALRIASNVLRDTLVRDGRLRRASEDEPRDPEGCEAPAGEAEPEPPFRLGPWTIEREEARRLLREALSEARQEDREVLRSFYEGRGSCRATAAECGVPAPLVKVRLFRARERVRREIRRRAALAARSVGSLRAGA